MKNDRMPDIQFPNPMNKKEKRSGERKVSRHSGQASSKFQVPSGAAYESQLLENENWDKEEFQVPGSPPKRAGK
jgi:hypothetical protein